MLGSGAGTPGIMVINVVAFIHRFLLLNNGDLLSIECEVIDVQMVMMVMMVLTKSVLIHGYLPRTSLL